MFNLEEIVSMLENPEAEYRYIPVAGRGSNIYQNALFNALNYRPGEIRSLEQNCPVKTIGKDLLSCSKLKYLPDKINAIDGNCLTLIGLRDSDAYIGLEDLERNRISVYYSNYTDKIDSICYELSKKGYGVIDCKLQELEQLPSNEVFVCAEDADDIPNISNMPPEVQNEVERLMTRLEKSKVANRP